MCRVGHPRLNHGHLGHPQCRPSDALEQVNQLTIFSSLVISITVMGLLLLVLGH
jgi:hypothetical protein